MLCRVRDQGNQGSGSRSLSVITVRALVTGGLGILTARAVGMDSGNLVCRTTGQATWPGSTASP